MPKPKTLEQYFENTDPDVRIDRHTRINTEMNSKVYKSTSTLPLKKQRKNPF